jgi:arsenate reductase (thioredoxin)
MSTPVPKPKTILVLCTGNSARSIMAEAYLNQIGKGQWRAVSAGSKPTGRVNPFALLALAEAGIPSPENARSKSWNEFAGDTAPAIDLVLTVCDNAAGETCPHFPGPARKVHIGFPDPAAVEGTDQQKLAAFLAVLDQMRPKLKALVQNL